MILLLTTISCCSKYVGLGLYYFQFSVPVVTALVDVILIKCFRRISNVTILRSQPCLVLRTLYIIPSFTGRGRNNSHILKVNKNQTKQGTQKNSFIYKKHV